MKHKKLPKKYKLPYSPTTFDWEMYTRSRVDRLEYILERVLNEAVDCHMFPTNLWKQANEILNEDHR